MGSHALLHLPRSTSWQETEKMPENLMVRQSRTDFSDSSNTRGRWQSDDSPTTSRRHQPSKKGSKEKQKRPPLRKANKVTSSRHQRKATLPPLCPSPICGYIAQVEVFEHIPPITTGQYRIAITARSRATDGFWSRFTSDHLIKSASVCKGEERQRPAARHDYAPKKPFDLSNLGLRANEFPTDRRAD
jgi:hypothetical protein